MIKEALKKGQLYINYLGPLGAVLGSLVATPVLISNLGLKEWSLFALINILLPIIYFILFGSNQIARRLMVNINLSNNKTRKSIEIFYKNEKKIFVRFLGSIIFLFFLLVKFNSDSYQSFQKVELTFFLISIAVLIKIYEIYYTDTLNGLKQHYKLNISSFIITIIKWCIVIYLSFIKEININYIILVTIIFSLLLITLQRFFITNIFNKKIQNLKNQISQIASEYKGNNFGIIIILFMILQQFDKILVFGILDPLSISYFGIAFMLSSIVPFIISPFIGYLTPEIYMSVEKDIKSRKKYFLQIIIAQFAALFVPLIIINLYLDTILNYWLGSNVISYEVSFFLIPISISTLSISLLNSLKVLFIGENKISLFKKPLIAVLILCTVFTTLIYTNIFTVQIYLYCLSITISLLTIYFYIVFFKKNYIVNR